MLSVLWLIAAYVLGAIPFGLLIAKKFCGLDPRADGSGNIGATNVARLCGLGWGVLVLFCDALKGAVAVLVAMKISDSTYFHCAAALAAIIGHRYSLFLRFKGGKAVATTVGVFAPLAFWPLVGAGILCLLAIWFSGFVSLGSLVLVTVLPVLLALNGQWQVLPLALLVAAIVYYAHRENIRRLINKEEKPWLTKKNTSKG